MADTLELEIVTPDKLLVKEPAERYRFRARPDSWMCFPGTLR